jgi:hypothetical protein
MAMNRRTSMLLLACAPLLCTVGCFNFGKVEQGRVIAYDKQQRVVLLIRDSAPGAEKPKYDLLPPVAVKIPDDPKEMGPEPEAGKRLLFDPQNKRVVIYDAGSGSIKTITYTPLTELAGIAGDDRRVKGLKFPVVDRAKKVITMYSSREKRLVTFTVAEEYFALPDDTWKAGDDVRYYYKQPGQALRLMNVTKTNVMQG